MRYTIKDEGWKPSDRLLQIAWGGACLGTALVLWLEYTGNCWWHSV